MNSTADLGVEDVFKFADVTSEEGGWLVVDACSSESDVVPDAVSFSTPIDPDIKYEGHISEDDLQDIESDLYPEDVARILFLAMNDTSSLVLQKCCVAMTRHQTQAKMVDSFSEWARVQVSSEHSWKLPFLESLALIGRKDILANLGFDDSEMRRLLKPVHLSSLKVSLNQVCISLKQKEMDVLVAYVSQHHLQNRPPIQFPEGKIIKQLLELRILNWMQEGIMDLTDLSVLADALEHIGRPDLKAVLIGEPSGPSTGGHTKVVSLPSLAGDLSPFVYPNDKGVCVIFNQEQFSCEDKSCCMKAMVNHGLRLGSSEDAKNLARVFSNFQCRTKIFTNCKGTQMDQCLQGLGNANDLSQFDFIVVCFLSHGSTEDGYQFIYSSDCQKLFIDDLIRPLEGDKCQGMRRKMKMIITQSCQGQAMLGPLQADGPTDMPPPLSRTASSASTGSRGATAQSDFLFCQATTPGYKAYRDPRRGSFYIMRLCEVLESRGHLEEVSLCIKDVHKLLIEAPIALGSVPCAIQPQMIDRTQGRFRFKRTATPPV